VLAQAVQDLHPEARLGIGPPVENGFYYDFDVNDPFSPEDSRHRSAHRRAAGPRFAAARTACRSGPARRCSPRRSTARQPPRSSALALHQAAVHAARGRSDEAVALATHANRRLRSTDLLTLRADVLIDLASALAARGDTAIAARAAEHALTLYTEKGNTVAAQHARNIWSTLIARPC